MGLEVLKARAKFPSLYRVQVGGRPAAFFDGPAGSQVPRQVVEAVEAYLGQTNANLHGHFVTSLETDWMLSDTRMAVCDLLGTADEDEIVFGPNMTTLTLSLSRALGRTWGEGDEVVVTRMDHDANVWPWVQAARDAGAVVRYADLDPAHVTLDLDSLDEALSDRTVLVAVGAASNAVGTLNPIPAIAERVHAVGAELFVDAVHYAPHRLIDVPAWGCDWLACSAYKFFGPHVGILWGRRERLEDLAAYRVRPAGDAIPGKWETGTQSHEGIAGVRAAVGYLAGLGEGADRRSCLADAFEQIAAHEAELARRMLRALQGVPGLRVLGISDPDRFDQRVPTFGVVHDAIPAEHLAMRLGSQGIFTWSGHFYAVELTERLGLEPEGMLRVGALHYNTADEVDRLADTLARIVEQSPS